MGRIKRLDLSEVGVASRFGGGELRKELPRSLCCGSAVSLPSLAGPFTSAGGADMGSSSSIDRGYCVTSAGGFGGAKGAVSAVRTDVAAIAGESGREAFASGGDVTDTGGGGGKGLDSSAGSVAGVRVRVRGDGGSEARGDGDSGGEKRAGLPAGGGDGEPATGTPVGP